MLTELRFILKNDKRILQYKEDAKSLPIGCDPQQWFDVPFVDTKGPSVYSKNNFPPSSECIYFYKNREKDKVGFDTDAKAKLHTLVTTIVNSIPAHHEEMKLGGIEADQTEVMIIAKQAAILLYETLKGRAFLAGYYMPIHYFEPFISDAIKNYQELNNKVIAAYGMNNVLLSEPIQKALAENYDRKSNND